MKSITRLSALGVLALGLAGCAEDNEKAVTADPTTGKSTAAGKADPNKSIKNTKNLTGNDLMQSGNYKANAAGGAGSGK